MMNFVEINSGLSFLYTDFDNVSLRLPDLDYWLTSSVTGEHGMINPSRNLIPPLVYPGVRVCLALFFGFLGGLRYSCLFISLRYGILKDLFTYLLINISDFQL